VLVESTRLPTLLVVDDDPAILELMDRFATELGFTVVQERNGRAALASLPRTRPDGAIVDVSIADYTVDAAFGMFRFTGRPAVEYPFVGRYAPSESEQ